MVLSSVERISPFFLLSKDVLQGYNDSCVLDSNLGAYLYMFAAYFSYHGVGKSRKLKTLLVTQFSFVAEGLFVKSH